MFVASLLGFFFMHVEHVTNVTRDADWQDLFRMLVRPCCWPRCQKGGKLVFCLEDATKVGSTSCVLQHITPLTMSFQRNIHNGQEAGILK